MTAIAEKDIQSFIETNLLDGRAIAVDEDLVLSGLLDSLAVMSLVAHLESRRDTQIPAQDITIENFSSVANIARYLNGA